MGGVGHNNRSSEFDKQARGSSRLLSLTLSAACVSLVACMSGLSTRSTSVQAAPSTDPRQESTDDPATPQASHSLVQQASMQDHPPARAVAAPDATGREDAATHPASPATVISTQQASGDAELILHPQASTDADVDVEPTAVPGEAAEDHSNSDAPVKSFDVPVQSSLPRALHYVWWVVAAALMLLGIRWVRRREPSVNAPQPPEPALDIEPQQHEEPQQQESAPLPEVLQETVPNVSVTQPIEMEQLPIAATREASPMNVAPLNVASFVPRTVVQVTLARLSPSSECTAAAPARDLRRARLLFQQGEFELALAPVLSHLRDLQREHPDDDNLARPRVLPDPLRLDATYPVARAITALHADIRWRLARRSRSGVDHAQAVCALEAYLAFRSGDLTARLRLGRSLLDLAEQETDAVGQESLLQYSIDILFQPVRFEAEQEQSLLALLGEALCRKALQAPIIDQAQQAEAEKLLRQAIAMGPMQDTDAAWWLQKSLTTTAAGKRLEPEAIRLNEAIALLQDVVNATAAMPERSRWLAALLRAELKQAHVNLPNVLALRLRLRDLHERYAGDMQAETSPNVLAAWVELLCAMAGPLVGSVALARYREVDEALERLSARDTDGRLHASAWVRMAQGRLRVESGVGRRDLLQRAESLLAPCLDRADPALRIEAGHLALAQAVREDDLEERNAAYARVLAFVRPLTGAASSLAVPALRCALKATLALSQDEDRRAFAAHLGQLAPGDTESLELLAASALQDGMPA
jgi:hypothetical protein